MLPGINGFTHNPSASLEEAFQAVAQTQMRQLPFYRAHIPVRACGFQLFEHQWLGCMLTPWMLSLMVLPGPGEIWPTRAIGEKLALALPCGNVRFTVGEMDGCGQYLASSLMSPLQKHNAADTMIMLAEQTARMALSLPVVDSTQPENPGRRAFFRMPARSPEGA
ncbi:[NiFe] hydrogenase assembly HybE family chaperone [Buttiauxella sp. BIGb0471]|uniref:hydrogenase-2 assembly chaperone n=1 Tax=Buttiauxella sp. BIGb0471 TaxID=2940597 RepID=UPI0021697FF2|nr:hydrogenase-2 assembly chaperone [Buttiauxella sp. BIGb0471]MCS3601817.1 [NiFe] hydrogenase assembly HybE family chaperone [Buttiauxella sp. BIGb0471]